MRYKWLILGLAVMIGLTVGMMTQAAPDPGVERFLQEMYALRARALLTGQSVQGLDAHYDLQTTGGKNALAHEVGRIQYMQAWAPARQLKVTEAETLLTNLRVKVDGDTATVSLISRTRLAYEYDRHPGKQEMGVGSWHWLKLTRRDGVWRVATEFYLDAMGDEWTEPFVGSGTAMAPAPDAAEPAGPGRGRLDRHGATAYAEKYCGAAWGCGNNSDYNQRYHSYKNLGGDCANFASQVLTEGAKLKPDWVWRHDKAGSTCWVNAQAFVRYLAGSGRASVVARGNYAQVAPALSKLQPGDIIGYQRKGVITHVSVVTGADSAGVPIVAAHTADRFRNPWDLGWDKATTFWLVHLHN